LKDIVLFTGFLSYSGPFNQEYRTYLMQSWNQKLIQKNILKSPNLNVTDEFADALTISEWNLLGLLNDELSTQNDVIVTKSSKCTIMIHLQNQGISWIKNKEAINDIRITFFDDKYVRNHLENCVLMEKPLLIQDILQDVDPVINNILEKNYYKVGRTLKVLFGDKEIDVSEHFRLYFSSKLGNPSYPPELYARCVVINFTVTMNGLVDQLLSRVIETEKRELEQERIELITEVISQKQKMQKLEHDFLVKLTIVKESLVDDETVLYTLNKTKDTSMNVSEKLEVRHKSKLV
jgi:dynein heavy chain